MIPGGGRVHWYHPLIGPVSSEAGWAPPLRYLLRRDRVLRLVRGLAVGRYLEIGCGGGALVHEMAALGWDALGIETSERALGIAKSLREIGGGGQSLSSDLSEACDGAWDLVAALDVLEHIEDQEAAVRAWVGKLASRGMLLISVPAHPSRWGAGDQWAGHFRRYTAETLKGLLGTAGLEIVHLECYGFPLANVTELLGEPYYRRQLAKQGGRSQSEATASSGVDRRVASRLSAIIASRPFLLALRLAFWAQDVSARTDWGSGYLVLARKP